MTLPVSRARRLTCGASLVAALALGGGTLPAQRAASREAPAGTISHVWKPERGEGTQVTAIAVRTVVETLPAEAAERFTLSVPITYAGVRGIAERVQDLVVRDEEGDVPLVAEDEAPHPGGFPHYRRWRAQRRLRLPLTLTYRALAPDRLVGGPPFGLYAAHGGVSGAGSGFLVLPEGRWRATSRVRWDLSELGSGARAVTTFGEGEFEVQGSPAELRQGWIMAGPIGRYPAQGAGSGFFAFWLGEPMWDAQEEMAWANRMYQWLGQSYRYLDPLPPYRVFVRVGGRGGTALANSFMVGAAARAAGATAEGQSPRGTITHEMGHMFVGGIEAPMGVSSWFSEGLNTYYTRLLPLRGGFTSVEDYGREINRDMDRYYFNVARNLSADSIVRVGFNDENIRHIPYTRGSLYFADLDSKIRAHSRGRRNLDAVLLDEFRRRQGGEPFSHDTWIATVVREAGAGARADFEGIILRGDQTLVPASDAFGPCFVRRATPARTVDGRERGPGYEWVRVAGVADEECRKPW